MRTKLTTISALVITVSLLASFLVGCGTNTPTTTAAENKTTDISQTTSTIGTTTEISTTSEVTTTTTNTTTETSTTSEIVTTSSSSSTSITTEPGSASAITFGEMGKIGEDTHNGCIGCHGFLWVSDAGRSSLYAYGNADNILNKLWGHRGFSGEKATEVLCYILMEQKWVSADKVFDLNKLYEIILTP